VRHSAVLNLQPGETQTVHVKLDVDCDLISTHETPHARSRRTTNSEDSPNAFPHELPFHEDIEELSADVRRVHVEFPDGYKSPLSTVNGKDRHRGAPLLHSFADCGTYAFRSRSQGSGHDPSRFGNVNEELGGSYGFGNCDSFKTSLGDSDGFGNRKSFKASLGDSNGFGNQPRFNKGLGDLSGCADGSQNSTSTCPERPGESCPESDDSALGFLQIGYFTAPSSKDLHRNNELQVVAGVAPCVSGSLDLTVTIKANNDWKHPNIQLLMKCIRSVPYLSTNVHSNKRLVRLLRIPSQNRKTNLVLNVQRRRNRRPAKIRKKI